MSESQKPNLFKQILQRKAAARKGGGAAAVIADKELSSQFSAGSKPQPVIRRGGRNRSGKP